jgi:hypothetical protein
LKHNFLFIFFIFLTTQLVAQRGFLLVKKNNKTVATYTTGQKITIQHIYGFQNEGLLAHIRTDSFSLLNYRILRKSTFQGFVYFDTIYNGYTFYNIADIKSIERRKPKGFGFKLFGGIGKLSGVGLGILNIANGRRFGYSGYKEYTKAFALNGILPYVAGALIGKLYKTHFVFRKKYSISLMEF